MSNIIEIKPYEGTGKEFGRVAAAVVSEFRKRGEQGKNDYVAGGDIFPRTVLLNEEGNFMILEASDCTVGDSGRNFGHRVFLNLDKPNSLESNFSSRTVKVRSPWGARREVKKLVELYQDANWKDLVPRRS